LNNINKKVLLIGTPNVGKSTVFKSLTNAYAEISNYPGTTVEIITGYFKDLKIIDTPGVNTLCLDSDEDKITFQYLAENFDPNKDLVINIINAATLEKDLFLSLNLIDLRIPFVLVLNQIDQARKKDLTIKVNKLEKLLGVKIFVASSINQESLKSLSTFILGFFSPQKQIKNSFLEGNISFESEKIFLDLLSLPENQGNQNSRINLLKKISSNKNLKKHRNKLDSLRRKRADNLFNLIVQKNNPLAEDFLNKLSDFLVHPVFGTLSSLLLIFLILYQFLGILVAGNLVDFLENKIFNKYYVPLVSYSAANIFPTEIRFKEKSFYFPKGILNAKKKNSIAFQELSKQKELNYKDFKYYFSPSELIENEEQKQSKLKQTLFSSVGTILFGNYGIFTLAVTYLLGVLLPMVWCFYLVWAILEDSGYLPRLAALTDRWMKILGLNGRGIIPLVLGFGCVTMAVVTTRLMSTKKERIIMMILLGLAIPCSAQLSLIQGLLIKEGGFWGWFTWILVIFGVFLLMGFLANKFIPGKSQPLLLDLSPLRIPILKNIIYKANQKSLFFLKESSFAFIIASLVVCIFQVTGILKEIINIFEPLVSEVLGLPKEVALSFLLGVVRRDFGAFGLLELDLNQVQVTVACVSLTLFVPCVATVGVMIKEAGWKVASIIWLFSWFMGFSVGFLVKETMNLF